MTYIGKCYCGGIIRLLGCLDDLPIGQEIIVNKTGHIGIILLYCISGRHSRRIFLWS